MKKVLVAKLRFNSLLERNSMATCLSCGNDVSGKKFCPDCGTPVQAEPATSSCPRCGGSVRVNAAFCMHCGASLGAQALASIAPSQPSTQQCPACHTQMPANSAFCTNCGQNMQPGQASAPAAPAAVFCGGCGSQNNPGARFCNNCGSALTTGTPAQTGPYGSPAPYGQQPYTQQPSQYQSQPYIQQPPQYGQQPYAQQQQYAAGYPPQQQYQQPGYQTPMLGQQPMVLRCPICMAMAPVGTAACPSCHTSLAGVVPTPATVPMQGQQQQGGFLQGDAGKFAMGALGGAAAVIGGEMLLNGIGNALDGDNYEHHHHHGGGLLEGLDDIGIF